MAFRFRLDTLLRLRQNTERQETLRLQAIGRRLSAARKQYDDNLQNQRTFEAQYAEYIRSGTAASELQFMCECKEKLLIAASELQHSIVEIEREFAMQKEALTAERQKREVLETLRNREHESYLREQRRNEQKLADELFLMLEGQHESAL